MFSGHMMYGQATPNIILKPRPQGGEACVIALWPQPWVHFSDQRMGWDI